MSAVLQTSTGDADIVSVYNELRSTKDGESVEQLVRLTAARCGCSVAEVFSSLHRSLLTTTVLSRRHGVHKQPEHRPFWKRWLR